MLESHSPEESRARLLSGQGTSGGLGEMIRRSQFSRSIYRDLVSRIDTAGGVERTFAARRKVLEACEATIQRLVCDRRYFARPTKTLFSHVRQHIALPAQC